MTPQDHRLPTDEEIAASLQRAQEFIAKLAAVPQEERHLVTNPKFYGPIGEVQLVPTDAEIAEIIARAQETMSRGDRP